MTIYSVTLEEDPLNGDVILPIPPEIMAALDLKEGDELNWLPQEDGSIVMKKMEKCEETELVLVSTTLTYVMDYVIEVPKGKAEYALDSVVDAPSCSEFRQRFVGHQTINHRVISPEEVCAMAREYNPHLNTVRDETILNDYVTREPK